MCSVTEEVVYVTEEKVRENRLRRAAARQGLMLRKSRRRDPKARDYDRYWLVVPEINSVVAGGRYGWSLDVVNSYLDVKGRTPVEAMRSAAWTRQLLAEYLRNQARWRAEKADEYPDDDRNARSAAALTALATHVEALPESDESLLSLTAMHEMQGGHIDVYSPSEMGNHVISRFGFDRVRFGRGDSTPDFDDFLSYLASVEAEEVASDA